MASRSLKKKKKALDEALSGCDRLLVAFSGGVDSSFLLFRAHRILGDRVVAVTVVSPVHIKADELAAASFVKAYGIRHLFVNSTEMDHPEFTANPPERCYICKNIKFSEVRKAAAGQEISRIAHGANADDGHGYRPGLRAAQEMGILSPLADAGMTKADIRKLSRQMGLPTWNRPSSGCLATRIPYGDPITIKKLQMVENAESVLKQSGFNACRVRHFGDLAKIEVPHSKIERILVPAVRERIIGQLKHIGYLYVTLDLEGFSSGRLDRSLRKGADR